MMKPFDLEAAKRGEPIVRFFDDGSYRDAHFVGARTSGDIVVELNGETLMSYRPDQLRMKPQKRTVYLVARRDSIGGPWYLKKSKADEEAYAWNVGAGRSDNPFVVIPVEIEL